MFGNKVKMDGEELALIREQASAGAALTQTISEHRDTIDSNFTEIAESQKQMSQDMRQVQENGNRVQEYSVQNLEALATMIHRMEELIPELQTSDQEYQKICELARQNLADSENGVEQNKHFTSPSRYLSELPEEFRKKDEEYLAALDDLGGISKQMGVLALNAAIEAGRMGASGKNFVSAVEDVRSYTVEYDKGVAALRDKIAEQDRKLDAMEDIIQQFVNLVKDTNINMTKLMRSVSETVKATEKSSIRPYAQDVSMLRDAALGVRNLEEEIQKSIERNRMQTEDILTEMSGQQKDCREMYEAWTSVSERQKEFEREETKEGGES